MADVVEPVLLGLATPALAGRVSELTTRALSDWSRRWGVVARCEVGIVDVVHLPAADGVEEVREFGATPGVVLALPLDLQAGVEAALFGAAPAGGEAVAGAAAEPSAFPADTLGARAARAVVEDLRSVLSRAWQVRGWTADADPRATPGGWHAALQVDIEVVGRHIVACLPGLRFRPSASADAPRMTPVKATVAFATLQTTLQAAIGHAELPLADIANLQPGDVLLLDASLNDPISLRLDDGALELRAYLGAAATGRRAVQAAASTRS